MPLVVDVETTTKNKGDPYDFDNQLVTVGLYNDDVQIVFDITKDPKSTLKEIQQILDQEYLLIGFNLKFDLAWLRRYGIDTSNHTLWDCQVLEYKRNGHKNKLESLDTVLQRYNLPVKLDKIKEYWEKGIDTLDIPRQELIDYNLQDVRITWFLYQHQLQTLDASLFAICSLANEDIHTLLEMEWHGLVYAEDLAKKKAEENDKQIEETKTELNKLHSIPNFNWNSGDHLSALLFGGTITDVVKEPVGFYKTGPRKGEIKLGNKKVEYRLKRRYKPEKKQALAKEGYYSTSDEWLARLPDDGVASGIKLMRRLTKENGTYLLKNLNMIYQDGYIHTSFNNTLTSTGRLSSNNPNMQNQVDAALECFVSRYSNVL